MEFYINSNKNRSYLDFGSTFSENIRKKLINKDDTFNQYVYSRSSYRAHEIIWGAKFISIVDRGESQDKLTIDIGSLNEYKKVLL